MFDFDSLDQEVGSEANNQADADSDDESESDGGQMPMGRTESLVSRRVTSHMGMSEAFSCLEDESINANTGDGKPPVTPRRAARRRRTLVMEPVTPGGVMAGTSRTMFRSTDDESGIASSWLVPSNHVPKDGNCKGCDSRGFDFEPLGRTQCTKVTADLEGDDSDQAPVRKGSKVSFSADLVSFASEGNFCSEGNNTTNIEDGDSQGSDMLDFDAPLAGSAQQKRLSHKGSEMFNFEDLTQSSPSCVEDCEDCEDVSPRCTGVRVAILVNGSRGDLQPLIALACRLRRYQHEICILTNANLLGMCRQYGLPAKAVFVDQQAVIESMGGMSGKLLDGSLRGKDAATKWLEDNPDICGSAAAGLKEFRPDATIASFQSLGPGLRYELETGAPMMVVGLQMEVFGKDFMDWHGGDPLRPSFLAASPCLNTDTISADLARGFSCFHQVGPWILEERPSAADLLGNGCLAKLNSFLAQGDPPIVVGWGSMLAHGLEPTAMLVVAMRVLKAHGRRGVVLGGWARLDEIADALEGLDMQDPCEDLGELLEFAKRNICMVPSAPHAWLFPQCSCILHHGGAGTTQAALLAGRPSVITPVFGDQFAQAQAIIKLDAGVGFDKALPELSVQQMVDALRVAEGKVANAERVGGMIRHEEGVKIAVCVVDAFLREDVKTGRWYRRFKKVHGQLRRASK